MNNNTGRECIVSISSKRKDHAANSILHGEHPDEST